MNIHSQFIQKVSGILFVIFYLLIIPFTYFAMMSRKNIYALNDAALYTGIVTALIFVICSVYCFLNWRYIHCNKLDWAIIIYTLCLSVSLLFNWVYLKNLLRDTLFSFFWVVVYFFSRISCSHARKKIIKFLYIYIVSFTLLTTLLFARVFFLKNTLYTDRVTGMVESYFLLCLVPLILCINRKMVCNLMLALVFTSLIFSGKRAGIFAFTVAILPYIFQFYSFKRLISSIALVCILIAVSFQINYEYWDFLFRRVGKVFSGDMAGREYIWGDLFIKLSHGTIVEWLFGRGRYSVEQSLFSGFSAHNDYIQVLFDHGLIALIPLIGVVIMLLYTTYLSVKTPWFYSTASALSIVAFLTMFSHLFYYPTYFIYISFYWGYVTNFLYEKHDHHKENNALSAHDSTNR